MNLLKKQQPFEISISVVEFIDICCNYYCISKEIFISKDKTNELPLKRQICYLLIHQFYNLSETQISKYFHGINRTTIRHGIKVAANYLEVEDQLPLLYYNDLFNKLKEYKLCKSSNKLTNC